MSEDVSEALDSPRVFQVSEKSDMSEDVSEV